MKHEVVCIAQLGGFTTTSNAYTTDGAEKPLNGINADVNATEADLVEFYTAPVLGGGESVGIFIVSAGGALVPARDVSLGVVAILDPTHQSVLVPGGMIYRLVKTATVAPTEVGYYFKPRNK